MISLAILCCISTWLCVISLDLTPVCLDNFLLPEDSPILVAEFQRRLDAKKSTRRSSASEKSLKWPSRHVTPCDNTRSGVLLDPVEATLAPWLDTLEDRDRDALSRLPKSAHDNLVINLSQSKGRQGETHVLGAVAIGCVTPGALEWLLQRHRPMLGVDPLVAET
jgi:hypothetical protein